MPVCVFTCENASGKESTGVYSFTLYPHAFSSPPLPISNSTFFLNSISPVFFCFHLTIHWVITINPFPTIFSLLSYSIALITPMFPRRSFLICLCSPCLNFHPSFSFIYYKNTEACQTEKPLKTVCARPWVWVFLAYVACTYITCHQSPAQCLANIYEWNEW